MLDAAKPIDLMEQWQNGNQQDAVRQMLEMTPLEVAVTMTVIAGLRLGVAQGIGAYLVANDHVQLGTDMSAFDHRRSVDEISQH